MDPVIVAGAGPVGLALALALTRHEVPVLVLDEGTGTCEARPARTTVLRPETAAFVDRLAGAPLTAAGARWAGWRTLRRRQVVRHEPIGDERGEDPADPGAGAAPGDPGSPGAPVHLARHDLVRGLRAALEAEELARIVPGSRLYAVEQDGHGVTAHTRLRENPGPGAGEGGGAGGGSVWRGSHLVGCDGARSTVRKLLEIRFTGRTAVERHAVAALRARLPWPGEAVLQLTPRGGQILARPLPEGVWRVDWLLPPRGDLVTPEALVERIRETLAAWCGEVPPYDLLDTGVHTVHHRLARRWRSGRCFLAGDAAHLLGALGTQEVEEGLRDAANLAWKLALAWHHGGSARLLDSYQGERRLAVGARLRAADQALPLVRATGAWSAVRRSLPGAGRGPESLLADGHLGRGPLGAPPVHTDSPLTPSVTGSTAAVDTPPGTPVADVPVTAPDGATARLRDRLHGDPLVVFVAPGTGVWERRHWMGAGLMPRLADAVAALPVRAELLVTEGYPGAAAHTVLVVRPDGHLAAALPGVRPAELYACVDTLRGGEPASGTDGERASGGMGTDAGPPGGAGAPRGHETARAPDRGPGDGTHDGARGGTAPGGTSRTGAGGPGRTARGTRPPAGAPRKSRENGPESHTHAPG
ncbi:FAD-dependent monooxygenase [Streptomyces zingiberis]|uniref:Monooxygenase n=1 Tax=Streptomyces zingiberis TaxID=2053010 RepID=A0ABX1C2R3_9ACTN|nr:FAD-dependent monooxygenase [Streptomyces zingiberis]NJQ01929.1 monooxygenase [Streptomyces zingiberis]